VVAYPLNGLPGRPDVIAEFAGILVLERIRGQLRAATPTSRLPRTERANLQWIYWGDLITPPGGQLSIGHFAIAPWPGAEIRLEAGATPFHGLSGDVLRALNPGQIVPKVIERLTTLEQWQRFLAERYGRPAPKEQQALLRQALQRARQARRVGRKYPDSHYRDIALIYLDLLDQGYRRGILIQLAEQLGIRRETARDWVHRARELGYLTTSQHGRAGAQPGPQLYST
jgi:hypothetical protein